MGTYEFDEMRLPKCEFELLVVAGLLDRMGIPSSAVVLESRDSPDVVAQLNHGRNSVVVACEVRQLDSLERKDGTKLRKFEATWWRLTKLVNAQLKNQGLAIFPIIFEFADNSYDCLHGVKATEIVPELVQLSVRLGGSETVDFPQVGLPNLSELLVKARRTSQTISGFIWWPSHMQSGAIDRAAMGAAVSAAVREKSIKAGHYDWGDADEKWLVLTARGYGTSDLVGTPQMTVNPSDAADSPFTSVLIWDKFSESVWTVAPEYAVILDMAKSERYIDAIPASIRLFILDD